MFLVLTIIVVPSIVALSAQLVCYQQHLESKADFAPAYALN